MNYWVVSLVVALWTMAVPDVPPVPITTTDVVEMMAKIPARCRGERLHCAELPGHYDRSPAAHSIADGIVASVNEETATVLDSPREDAALLDVFGAYESGMLAGCKQGDGGKSLGPWQLQRVRAGVACDPTAAAREWLRRAREAMRTCVENPPEERLALLASGSCDRARGLSRVRVELARRIAAVQP